MVHLDGDRADKKIEKWRTTAIEAAKLYEPILILMDVQMPRLDGISAAALHKWVRQDQVDRGERPGLTTTESAQLSKANKRIRQLEAEVEILRTAATLFGENRPAPKGFTR